VTQSKVITAIVKPTNTLVQFIKWLSTQPLLVGNILLSLFLILLLSQNQTSSPQVTASRFDTNPIFLTPPVPYPLNAVSPPFITAKSVYAIDPATGVELFKKNPDERLSPASTTKIMTALIALDEYPLDEIVTLENVNQTIGHTAELLPGKQMAVSDLLYALLVPSGNDAALALAQHHPLGYSHFVTLMNQKATSLGMVNTQYTNVSGLESPGHYASVRDLSILTKAAMEDSTFRKIVGTKNITVSAIDGSQKLSLTNLNELLGKVDGVIGVKTGWTEVAGECLVTYTIRDNHPVIVVVFGSSDRFGESKKIIEWIYQTYQWVPLESLTGN